MLKRQNQIKSGRVSLDRKGGVSLNRRSGVYFSEISNMGSEGKMPRSGTYTSLGFNKFLLFNNTRYFEDSKLSAKDYHFPIKLSFKSNRPELLTIDVMKERINQVYTFSRMYWKSVSQQNLPVTTIYPEMVAEIYPHFENENLPDFGKSNLWFL